MIKKGLVVEDLPDSRAWLTGVLPLAFPEIQVQAVATLNEGLARIRKQQPDIALVDLGLPDGSGIELIAELSQLAPQSTIVVTSIFDDDQHLFAALRAGATGYMLKDQSRETLVEMLKGIADGKPPLSPAIARRLLNFFAPKQTQNAKEEILTERERDVLKLIAKGYTVAKAAEILGITHNTTASYVKAIYKKLNVTSRAEATLEASRRGIISI